MPEVTEMGCDKKKDNTIYITEIIRKRFSMEAKEEIFQMGFFYYLYLPLIPLFNLPARRRDIGLQGTCFKYI